MSYLPTQSISNFSTQTHSARSRLSPMPQLNQGSTYGEGSHSRRRDARLEVVDLTTSPVHAQAEAERRPNNGYRRSSSLGSSSRRRGRTAQKSPAPTTVIDLADVDDDDQLQSKLEQAKPPPPVGPQDDEQSSKLSHFKCSICLDDPVDLAATPCGHLYCHRCLREALCAGQDSNARSGKCPLCRGTVRIKDIITLEIKLRPKDNNKTST